MIKLSKRQEKALTVVVFLLFIMFILYIGIIDQPNKEKELNISGCYTYCITKGTKYFYRRGEVVLYEYKYNNIIFDGHDLTQEGMKTMGGVYLIKVSKKDPENYHVFFNYGEIDRETLLPLDYYNSVHSEPLDSLILNCKCK